MALRALSCQLLRDANLRGRFGLLAQGCRTFGQLRILNIQIKVFFYTVKFLTTSLFWMSVFAYFDGYVIKDVSCKALLFYKVKEIVHTDNNFHILRDV